MAKRHLTVRLNMRGRDLASFLDEARQKLDARVSYDRARFQIAWGGQFENQQRAQARLALILPMVLALMFLLLFAEFRNLHQPLLVLVAVPPAALGGLIALHLRGLTLNVSSAVGFIALFGVAVLNAIIMVANLNRWRREMGVSPKEAVFNGARERLRPVLMTATVVVGGLITATALTLFLLPALYFLIEQRLGSVEGGRTANGASSESTAD
jgi:heavy metal efflux system protein